MPAKKAAKKAAKKSAAPKAAPNAAPVNNSNCLKCGADVAKHYETRAMRDGETLAGKLFCDKSCTAEAQFASASVAPSKGLILVGG